MLPPNSQEITVTLITHYTPNPERGLDLLIRLVLEEIFADEVAAAKEKS